jgi:vacuolar-type H+-ATPase subunit I/STV1
LDRLKAFQLSGDKKKDLEDLKAFLTEWKQYGRIPYNKKHINSKFNKIIDALFKKLGIGKQESELLKYGNKVQELAKTEDNHAIGNERVFVKRKIDEVKSEIRQLENNLQFFSGDSEDNPLVKEVVQKLNKQKDALQTWKEKMKNLNILEHKLNKESEAEEESDGGEEE